jgi:hypothetical protein
MNNTIKTLAAIAVMLIAATLVVGGTFAATSAHSAFAYQKKKGTQDNGNGNTVTIQKSKQDGTTSGFDNLFEQEDQNLICTHPGENSTCSQESTTPRTCEQCFTSILKPEQITRLLSQTQISSIADVCKVLEGKNPQNPTPTEAEVRFFLSQQVGLKDPTINELIACLKQAGIVFALTPPPR